MGKDIQKFRKHPELVPGVRVQYWDKSGALRTERIYSRQGNTLTVISALKEKTRIHIKRVQGYWKPKVKASPNNLIRIARKAPLFSGMLGEK